jgi:hypothetical protein
VESPLEAHAPFADKRLQAKRFARVARKREFSTQKSCRGGKLLVSDAGFDHWKRTYRSDKRARIGPSAEPVPANVPRGTFAGFHLIYCFTAPKCPTAEVYGFRLSGWHVPRGTSLSKFSIEFQDHSTSKNTKLRLTRPHIDSLFLMI